VRASRLHSAIGLIYLLCTDRFDSKDLATDRFPEVVVMFDLSHLTESKTWPLILKVKRILDDSGVEAYLVGGWVRDALLGREEEDVDFAVKADGLDVAHQVALAVGGTFVPLDEVNGVGRVVLQDRGTGQLTLDFARFEGTIEADLGRRDFTIDALALDLRAFEDNGQARVLDPFHGIDDLRDKAVRAVSDKAFVADPVRLLRGVRLAATLGFAMEAVTSAMTRRDAGLVSRVAGERVREELLLLLSVAGSGTFVEQLEKLGLLIALFPELGPAKGVIQPKEHYWDVLQHSIKTVSAFDFLVRQGVWEYADEKTLSVVPWSEELEDYFGEAVSHGSTRATMFKLVALLHDVAKPQTRTVEAGGRVRFLGHGQEGAVIAAEVMERLRFSAKETKLVETAVKFHLRPTQMGLPELPTARAIYRYYRDTGEAAVGILFLSLADHLATRGPSLDTSNWTLHNRVVEHILSQREREPSRLVRLIDGYDIMARFGLIPGRKLGEIIEIVREAQASGEVITREDAFDLVRRVLAELSRENENRKP